MQELKAGRYIRARSGEVEAITGETSKFLILENRQLRWGSPEIAEIFTVEPPTPEPEEDAPHQRKKIKKPEISPETEEEN